MSLGCLLDIAVVAIVAAGMLEDYSLVRSRHKQSCSLQVLRAVKKSSLSKISPYIIGEVALLSAARALHQAVSKTQDSNLNLASTSLQQMFPAF